MYILPIKSLREEDAPLVGKELVNLASLKQLGYPVPEGLVICPPEIDFKNTLEYLDLTSHEIFEQKLFLFKNEIYKIPVPQELLSALDPKKSDIEATWKSLLDFWISQLRSTIWREGLSPNLLKSLTAQPIFYTGKIFASGKAFIDQVTNQLVVEISDGKISEKDLTEVGDLVKKAQKKLFLPFIFQWVFDGNIKFVKIIPFTQSIEVEDFSNVNVLKQAVNQTKEQDKKIKTALKIFLNPNDTFRIAQDIDGLIIAGEAVRNYELRVWQLCEAAHKMGDRTVIYKLPDVQNKRDEARGALRLIHDKKLLDNSLEVFNFAREKKELKNIDIAVPYVRSVNEFFQIKSLLSKKGIHRKPSLNMWLEVSVVENVINLEDYIEVGLDGIIFDLDSLASLIGGFEYNTEESVFYTQQVDALEKLLEQKLKYLHQVKMPILIRGQLALNDDILKNFIKKGIFGLIVEALETTHIREHVSFIEKRRAL